MANEELTEVSAEGASTETATEVKEKRTRLSPRIKVLDAVLAQCKDMSENWEGDADVAAPVRSAVIEAIAFLSEKIADMKLEVPEGGASKVPYGGRNYLGILADGTSEVLSLNNPPSAAKFAEKFACMVGPFRHKAGAQYVGDHGIRATDTVIFDNRQA